MIGFRDLGRVALAAAGLVVLTSAVAPARAGTTKRVSVVTGGISTREANGPSSSPAISADGRFVAFVSSAATLVPGATNGIEDIFVRDRLKRTTELVSVSSSGVLAQGPFGSFAPSISAD